MYFKMAESKGSIKHHIRGEHIYDGMVFGAPTPPELLDGIKTFYFRDTDILVDAYPKSGITWMQAILDRVINKNDQEKVNSDVLDKKMPFMDLCLPGSLPTSELDAHAKIPDPRIMKSHLPVQFFERALNTTKAKFIIVMRNPKDALVSYYHFYSASQMFGPYAGTWDEFFEDLVKIDHLWAGGWFNHVAGWWKYKDYPNVIFFKYEDMKKNPPNEVKRLAEFLNIELLPETIEAIVRDTSFASMKDNKLLNKDYILKRPEVWDQSKPGFFRKGTVGDYKTMFTEEQSNYIDKRTEDALKGTDLVFDYSLSGL